MDTIENFEHLYIKRPSVAIYRHKPEGIALRILVFYIPQRPLPKYNASRIHDRVVKQEHERDYMTFITLLSVA